MIRNELILGFFAILGTWYVVEAVYQFWCERPMKRAHLVGELVLPFAIVLVFAVLDTDPIGEVLITFCFFFGAALRVIVRRRHHPRTGDHSVTSLPPSSM